MSLVPIHSKNVETQASVSKDILKFITTRQTAEIVTQPGLMSLKNAILQAVHIHACVIIRPKLSKDTDPASYIDTSISKAKIGEIVGCGDGQYAVSQERVMSYFTETLLQPDISNYMTKGGRLLYIWTSLQTYKQYVGQVQRVKNSLLERTKEHFGDAVRDFHKDGSRELSLAIRTHRIGEWVLQILRFVDSDEDLTGLENYYITKLNTMWPNGYNMKAGPTVEDPLTDHDEVRDTLSDLTAKTPTLNSKPSSDSGKAFIQSLNKFCQLLQEVYSERSTCQHILKLDKDDFENEIQKAVDSCLPELEFEVEGGRKRYRATVKCSTTTQCVCKKRVCVTLCVRFKFEDTGRWIMYGKDGDMDWDPDLSEGEIDKFDIDGVEEVKNDQDDQNSSYHSTWIVSDSDMTESEEAEWEDAEPGDEEDF